MIYIEKISIWIFPKFYKFYNRIVLLVHQLENLISIIL